VPVSAILIPHSVVVDSNDRSKQKKTGEPRVVHTSPPGDGERYPGELFPPGTLFSVTRKDGCLLWPLPKHLIPGLFDPRERRARRDVTIPWDLVIDSMSSMQLVAPEGTRLVLHGSWEVVNVPWDACQRSWHLVVMFFVPGGIPPTGTSLLCNLYEFPKGGKFAPVNYFHGITPMRTTQGEEE
jgi:hypothetical protein